MVRIKKKSFYFLQILSLKVINTDKFIDLMCKQPIKMDIIWRNFMAAAEKKFAESENPNKDEEIIMKLPLNKK